MRLRNVLLLVVAAVLSSGCEFGRLSAPATGAANELRETYGDNATEVYAARARAEVLRLSTEAIITNHKLIVDHLEKSNVTVYQLSYDADRNSFRLSYDSTKQGDK